MSYRVLTSDFFLCFSFPSFIGGDLRQINTNKKIKIDKGLQATTDTIVNVIMGPKNSLFASLGLHSVAIETDMPVPS